MKTLTISALLVATLTALAACDRAAEAPADATAATDWHLIGGSLRPLPAPATLRLEGGGQVGGQGPCNRWFAQRQGQGRAFRLPQIGATEMACPALPQEAAYFAALSGVTAIEQRGDRLILTGPGGIVLEFAAETR